MVPGKKAGRVWRSGGSFVRRIQVTGGSTYIVSLPKEWVKSVGLKHGSEIYIDVLPDYSLRIQPSPSDSFIPREKEIVVTPESLPIAIIEILSAYLAGHGSIRLRYENVDIRDVVKVIENARSKAIGLEVFEERDKEIMLYIIVDTSYLTLKESIEKLTNTTRGMLEDLERLMKTGNHSIVGSIVERDNVVDKLFLLAMRQLNQILSGKLSPFSQGLEHLPQALNLVVFLKSVERIADHTVLLAKNLVKIRFGSDVDMMFLELFKLTKNVYKLAVRGFNKKDRTYASKVLRHIEEARLLDNGIREKLSVNGVSPEVFLVLDSLRRIRAYSIDIVEAAINSIHVTEALGPPKV